MKIPILILACLGLVCGKPLPTGSLKDDLKEILALIPTDKVLETTLDYLANDQEVREFLVYIQSEEFPPIHTVVERLKEYKDCYKFINEQGVDVYAIVNEIHDILGLPPFEPTNTTRKGVGIIGLIDDVIAVLPLEDLAALLDKKLQTGEFFKTLVTAIHPPVFRTMVDTVQAWPEYPEMLEILREMVVYVERMSKLLREIYLRENHIIKNYVKEFMALLPTDEVLSITLDYIANDPEFHKAFVYIQSEEFPEIHKVVEYLKEYKECLKFINDEGVDVYAFIYEVNYILGLPPFPTTTTTRNGVGVYGLMKDVIAVLPLEDLKAYVDKKMENREYLKTLVTPLKSLVLKMVKTVNTVRSWPEYKKVLEIVREKGVNEKSITEILRTFYGPSLRGIHRLHEELKKYMALVPTDKVLEITLDYLANDQEVREFLVYIQSEEFPPIHTIVERLKEYKDCYKFINEQGVDVYAIINEIHDIFERHPYQPTNTTRTGVGFYGLIEDVVAVLPLEVLTPLFDKKIEPRELVKTLVKAIHSPVWMKMVETVRSWPEYPEMLQIVREMVVHVKRVSKLVWEISLRETQTIQNDVKEFMALLPTDKVLSITLDYIAKDPEFLEAVAYIQSEEFPNIHKVVEHLKEYKECLKFINDDGFDVYTFIYEVNYILGLPPFPTTNTTHTGVGIYGLMDDVIAVLPLDDLKALLDKKVETRIYFKIPVTALKSPLYVKMVNTVRALPEYQKLVETLRQMGVDVDRIIEHLRPLFRLYPL